MWRSLDALSLSAQPVYIHALLATTRARHDVGSPID